MIFGLFLFHMAIDLIKSLNLNLMKKIIFILLIIVSIKSKGQTQPQQKGIPTDIFNTNIQNNYIFKIGTGVFIPNGKLKEYLGTSPLFEINLNFPILDKIQSSDLVLQFVIPEQQKKFVYQQSNDTIYAKSSFIFNAFLKFKKELLSSKKFSTNINFGIGASIITTNAKNPFYTGKNDEEKYESITTLLIAPGIEFYHHISEKVKLTYSFNYHYAPYKIEGALKTNIGSSAIVPKILVSF